MNRIFGNESAENIQANWIYSFKKHQIQTKFLAISEKFCSKLVVLSFKSNKFTMNESFSSYWIPKKETLNAMLKLKLIKVYLYIFGVSKFSLYSLQLLDTFPCICVNEIIPDTFSFAATLFIVGCRFVRLLVINSNMKNVLMQLIVHTRMDLITCTFSTAKLIFHYIFMLVAVENVAWLVF